MGKLRQQDEGRITYSIGAKWRAECPYCHCMVWRVTASLDGDGLPVDVMQQSDGRRHSCRQKRKGGA